MLRKGRPGPALLSREGPGGDVECGVGISVCAVPALNAFENRLAFAVEFRDAAADIACLRCVAGIDKLEGAIVLPTLLLGALPHEPKSEAQHFSVEAALRLHAFARREVRMKLD